MHKPGNIAPQRLSYLPYTHPSSFQHHISNTLHRSTPASQAPPTANVQANTSIMERQRAPVKVANMELQNPSTPVSTPHQHRAHLHHQQPPQVRNHPEHTKVFHNPKLWLPKLFQQTQTPTADQSQKAHTVPYHTRTSARITTEGSTTQNIHTDPGKFTYQWLPTADHTSPPYTRRLPNTHENNQPHCHSKPHT